MELQAEHNFGMRVTGRTRGRTGLKVVLRLKDPMVGQLVDNLQELKDEIQIQVAHYCLFLLTQNLKVPFSINAFDMVYCNYTSTL